MARIFHAAPIALLASLTLVVGCGGNTAEQTQGLAASNGGAGGAAGNGEGTAGDTGNAGDTGTAGDTGAAGDTGTAGDGGAAGAAGESGAGGSAAGTGGASGGAAGDAGTAGAAGTSFVSAPHPAFPTVPNPDKGPVISAVQIVTITFAGYTYEKQIQDFADFVPGSQWLSIVGKDYGIGNGASFKKVSLTDTAPATISDQQIAKYIATKIGDGTLPKPSDAPGGASQMLYMIYYPSTTKISLPSGPGQVAQSCYDFGGYHNSTVQNGMKFAYAVLPTCKYVEVGNTAFDSLTFSASHELIEALTDPYPESTSSYVISDYNSPWAGTGGEVGDLCLDQDYVENGYFLQRSWSNAAAMASQDPCIPAPTDEVMYDAYPDMSAMDTLSMKAGQKTTVTFTGWSSAPTSDWHLDVFPFQGNFNPGASFDKSTLNNGQTATLTLSIPANTPSGSYTSLIVISGHSMTDYHYWPLAVYIP